MSTSTASPSADPYAMAGVNVALGDVFSSNCGDFCRRSYENSLFVKVHDFAHGHFRGLRGFSFEGLPAGCIQTSGSDGIGTKTILTGAANSFHDSAWDLLAMLGGDFTRYGALPLVVVNHLDVQTLGDSEDHPAYLSAVRLMRGLSDAAEMNNYVLLGGETAELRDCVTSSNPHSFLNYNWGGVMTGVFHPDKIIDGSLMKEGDIVIALREDVRSNGISLLREGLRLLYGDDWYKKPNAACELAVEQAAAPSTIYDRFLVHMNGWTTRDFVPVVRAHLIAHLSGGGIRSKFGEPLWARGFSAELNDLWHPPRVMKSCFNVIPGMNDHRAYETWGCGQGALVVVSPDDVSAFLVSANHFNIDACPAGVITKTPAGRAPSIKIVSHFTGEEFTYEAGHQVRPAT